MSKNTEPAPAFTERIQDIDVASEMENSFLEYAYSVIYSRALPDARDGLKPVQRRILYQMAEMGLRPDKGHVKSARVVGEVMGKLHPHGDSAIYDAIVRMAQDFSLRVPLIDGHGNFGSLDDGPAASRYTEVRLASTALAMTADLDEEVVDFVPNYDNQLEQPSVLPAAFPNLLVNGASGIAVGMATNMAPHNLGEVIAAARYLLTHPQASVEELMEYVPGPDLPTGGIITSRDGIRDAYGTGRGSFKVRARVSIEPIGPRKTGLVVSELPYLVGPEKVIDKIKEAVNGKKITGISDVTDLTDRKHGMRLVIGVKNGFDPEAVLEELYRLTPLEDSFSINNVALVDERPQTLGLRELLQVYLDHRIEVITRRSTYRLAKRKERLHLVDGLLIAIGNIDEVIQVIRTSDDAEAARTRLREVFDLSVEQADYILELRLRRLTKFSRIELESERDDLLAQIAELERLLASPSAVRAAVSDELEATSKQFATDRRTTITDAQHIAVVPVSTKKAVSLEAKDAPTTVVLTANGRIGRTEAVATESITAPSSRKRHDAIRVTLNTSTLADLGAVTSSGKVVRFTANELPLINLEQLDLGQSIRVSDFLGLSSNESVLSLIDLSAETVIAVGTQDGVVKRINPETYAQKADFDLISLKEGDALVGAAPAPDGSELVFVSSDGQLLRFPADSVRPQGIAAGGMLGMKLVDGARAIYFGSTAGEAAASGAATVVVTIATSAETLAGVAPGSAKVSDFTEFPAKGRGSQGVRAQRFLKGESELQLAWVGQAPALAVTEDGAAVEMPTTLAKRDASGSALSSAVGAIGTSAAN